MDLEQHLIEAVQSGKTNRVVELIENGADPLIRDSWLLRMAAMNGDQNTVKVLLNYCDVAAQDSGALRLAAESGSAACVKLLLPGSKPNALNSKALFLAAQNGHLEVVKILSPVSSFLNADGKIPHENGVLNAALDCGDPEILRHLLDNLSAEEDQAINYDFWMEEVVHNTTMRRPEQMQMFKMLNPERHLRQATAVGICAYNYHMLDADMAALVLERSKRDGVYPFVTERDKYNFLTLSVVLGRGDIVDMFLKTECNTEYVVDLIQRSLALWSEDKLLPNVVKVLSNLCSQCAETLTTPAGDAVLIAASSSRCEDIFKIFLPYCNLQSAHAHAQGEPRNLELLEQYNALRLKDVLNSHMDTAAPSQKRRM